MPLNLDLDIKDVEEPLWYRVQLERKKIKRLQGRTNLHGLLYFGGYAGLLAGFATFTVLDVLPVWGRVLSFLGFATVYAFSEAILHETHHRTAFRSPWLNEVVHYIAGVLAFKEPIRDRWLHAAHHTYTSYPELDPEVVLEPPPQFRYLLLDLFRLRMVPQWFGATLRNAISADELTRRYVPPSDHSRIKWSARAITAYFGAVVVASVVFTTWWPVLFVFVARFVGAWLHAWITLTQHAGLAMNIADWRENTRTVLMSPVNKFLVWNMNYHLEHHMNPTVPFHRLPKLHDELAADCPPAYPSTWNAWRELLPTLWKQRKNPSYFAPRPLPGSADQAEPDADRADASLVQS